ncbi:hypothetical protein [Risungbinella massiliensis]|uniref:hypothetical protein n=1 Tax=Risungbinella massiliensis TaxID=1329796 RepID=UPI00069AD6DA|nr:hypothetical protein [Risungbinella massiliensis]
MGGFFKIYREIFQHEIFKDELGFRLFMLIMGNAVYEKEGIEHKGMHLQRGQWVRSYRRLASDLERKEGRGYKKPSISTIKRVVDRLIKSHLVTISETDNGTLFTVVNYEKYQGVTGDTETVSGTVSGSLEERYRNKTKKDKKDKEEIYDDDADLWKELGSDSWGQEPTPQQKYENEIKSYFFEKAKFEKLDLSNNDYRLLGQFWEKSISIDRIKEVIDHSVRTLARNGEKLNSLVYIARIIEKEEKKKQARKHQQIVPFKQSKPKQQQKPSTPVPMAFREAKEQQPEPKASPQALAEFERLKQELLEKTRRAGTAQ